MRRLFGLVVALALFGATASACGDDDDARLSKAEFVKQANAVCSEGNQKFEALFENFPVTQAALAGFFEKATPIVEEQADRLRALDPPSEDEDTVQAIVDLLDQSVEDFEKAEKDPAFASQLFEAEGGEHTKEFEEKAAAYGMTECQEDEEEDAEGPERLDPATFSADKQAYIAKADAICAAANVKFRPVEAAAFEAFPPPLEAWAEFLPQIVAIYRPALAELQQLEPPAPDRATITDLFGRQSAILDRFNEAAGLAAAGDEDGFSNIMGPAFGESDEVDAALMAYGFQVCGPDDQAED